jgi:hypothetical protein
MQAPRMQIKRIIPLIEGIALYIIHFNLACGSK